MSEARYDVVGIGNAIVDILAHADDMFLSKHDAPKGTMLWVDEEQSNAMYDEIGPALEASGGSAANTMAGIASFGGSPAFIGKIADDQLGKIFNHDIRATGVHFESQPLSGGPATARCIILVTPDAQRTMFTYLGASGLLTASDVNDDLIVQSKILYIEGYQWDLPNAKAAIVAACKTAKNAKREVALTLSDPFVVERNRDELFDLINEHVDLLFANEQEVTALFRANSLDEAIESCEGRVKVAAFTRGPEGAVTFTKDSLVQTPADPLDKVMDTTGAGDLYAAGFLYGYAKGDPLKTCAKLGALAAGEVISHMGARPKEPLDKLARKAGYD